MSDQIESTSGRKSQSQSQNQTQNQSQSQSQSTRQSQSSPPESPAAPVTEEQEAPSSSGNSSSSADIGTSDPNTVAQGPEAAKDLDHESQGDRTQNRDEFGTQRVYKKTSPNCVLTLYLPTREMILTDNNPSVLRGIVFVDPKAIQGYRVYAQLTLTFRYGREDEEVMGLRFCNEAIMSLHQIWPRLEEPSRDSLSPLQEALLRRLGDGAHPFTLSLTAQAPPSVQLVPAKRYYGAPIGTSYDVRCFIADKTDEKFHRRAAVKMSVRVIYRTDVFHQHSAPEQFAAFVGQHNAAPSPPSSATPPPGNDANAAAAAATAGAGGAGHEQPSSSKGKGSKSERGDTFPKLRLSPKSFRFSGRFGRSKSEIERCPNDPFHCYSKSFQEHCDNIGSGMLPPHSNAGVAGGIGGISVGPCGGPQGAVDKPFLLHDGRVSLRASLDKGWYTHGENVNVTVNIRNDSRKTVRKVRVCAIQHVDVCMFNNGKFKNVVADSDNVLPPVDRTVPPGGQLNTTVALRPQRGPTKNWIALEDTLQRSTEPDEITGVIAASAIRSPNFVMQAAQLLTGQPLPSPAIPIGMPQPPNTAAGNVTGAPGFGEDRNVFAIYVSYYVKVKLTLSGMGGELSLKLPFVLVHIDESMRPLAAIADLRLEKLALHDVPAGRKQGVKRGKTETATTSTSSSRPSEALDDEPSTSAAAAAAASASAASTSGRDMRHLDCIEMADDEFQIRVPVPTNAPSRYGTGSSNKRRLQRSETLAGDMEVDEEEQIEQHLVQVHLERQPEGQEPDSHQQVAPETGAVPKSTDV
ncbi:uncharacterized protein LOC6565162 [Drosophila grimshawi]|uniref:GH12716 n=1 Tax=Drosophila grimshawi TaxID=7222 RepID=B4JKQ6_DROGR|nr:uncharacterized protein LOC6565162 [Drosophila grimshawi]EDW00159.1 GH12716 [Drosophila grimshawi]